jgi:replication fork protection complex subunit Tof1/Swi1
MQIFQLTFQVFFPKNRGQWKHFSSWEPEEKKQREKKQTDTTADVQIKKGHSWSDQIGIAIAVLVENGKLELITWTKDVSSLQGRDRGEADECL